MVRRRKSDDKQVAKLALITAILTLVTSLIGLIDRIIEWIRD